MNDLPPVGLRPAVHRGPRRGRTEQVLLASPAEDKDAAKALFNTYADEVREHPAVKEVIFGSPRRGKRKCRESAFMTVRFVRGISASQAVKLIKRIVAHRFQRLSSLTPAVRQERSERKRAKRAQQRQRLQGAKLERLLGPAY